MSQSLSQLKGLGFTFCTNCIGFASGVLSGFWAGFVRVSVITFDRYNLHLSGLEV